MSVSPTDEDFHNEEAEPGGAEVDAITEAIQQACGDDAAAADQPTNLETELASERDRVLRLQAEMENLRGRTAREVNEQRRYAPMSIIRDLLPVIEIGLSPRDFSDDRQGSPQLAVGQLQAVAEILRDHQIALDRCWDAARKSSHKWGYLRSALWAEHRAHLRRLTWEAQEHAGVSGSLHVDYTNRGRPFSREADLGR